MNYFKFYGLKESLKIDEAELKQKFYENSKRFHPDFFTLDDVEKQMEALEQSTYNNTAYKTLIDFERRLHYFLEMKGILSEEGSNQIPQEFLMEMMEVNEAIMELQFDFNQDHFSQLFKELEHAKDQLYKDIESLIPKASNELSEEDKQALKNYYLKSKYLRRLEDNFEKLGQE